MSEVQKPALGKAAMQGGKQPVGMKLLKIAVKLNPLKYGLDQLEFRFSF